MSLLDEVVQPSEGSKIPAWVAVIEMLLLIDRVMAGCTIWEWFSTVSATVIHFSQDS